MRACVYFGQRMLLPTELSINYKLIITKKTEGLQEVASMACSSPLALSRGTDSFQGVKRYDALCSCV